MYDMHDHIYLIITINKNQIIFSIHLYAMGHQKFFMMGGLKLLNVLKNGNL